MHTGRDERGRGGRRAHALRRVREVQREVRVMPALACGSRADVNGRVLCAARTAGSSSTTEGRRMLVSSLQPSASLSARCLLTAGCVVQP